MIDEKLIVRAGQQETEVIFGLDKNWVSGLRERYSKLVVFVDEQVLVLYPELKEVGDHLVTLKEGEAAKTVEHAFGIIDRLLELEIDRSAFFLAVGGGVATDLVGFLASIFKRGVNFGFVPTTILGAVDAAIGGKNGINHTKAKNMIGTTNQPAILVYDHRFFRSLSDEEFMNGMAEVLKYGLSLDIDLCYFLYSIDVKELRSNEEKLHWMIRRCLLIKSRIVEQDPFEQNVRKILNFGHTIGHAIEKLTGIKHGYAVAMGMYYETLISQKLGWVGEDHVSFTRSLLDKFAFDLRPGCSAEEIVQKVRMDKKRNSSVLDHIVVSEAGECRIEKVDLEVFGSLINTVVK